MQLLKNKVQLIGRLTELPQRRYTAIGTPYAIFILITSDAYFSRSGDRVNNIQWHRLVAWGKLGTKAMTQLHKGSLVAVEGKLIYHIYTDDNGMKRSHAEIQVKDILPLDAD